MKLTRKIIRRVLYGICLFFLIFYSGSNKLLDLYNREPNAFIHVPQTTFTPNELPVFNPPVGFNLSAQSYLVVDLDSFTPLMSKNVDNRMSPASLSKLLTSLVAFKHYSLYQPLIVDTIIEQEDRMGLVKGETISTLNLLYGTLIYSANDAAYTLAENFPGGVPAFVETMNKTAKDLHMQNSYFENPIGFDHPSQYTTAHDLALLAQEFIKQKTLLSITSTKSITVSDTQFQYFHTLTNINELLGSFLHVGGLKTGTTDEAGQNLITYFIFNNKPILIIILKSEDRFADTRTILDVLQNNLTYFK